MTEEVAKETTNEEIEAAMKELFPNAYDDDYEFVYGERPGIIYKDKYYEYDENGNPPERFYKALEKDKNK
jgi:hypothetical protein